ncbi:MAG: hypothetical protein Q9200_000382, partial [Gallowayella weberi]
MHYSVVATAVLVGAASAAMEGGVVSQIPDGQVQAPTSLTGKPVISSTAESPVTQTSSAAVPPEQTVYQTQTFTVTSCPPTVTVCPATTAPYVTTSVVPYVSGTPVNPVVPVVPVTNPAVPATTSTPVTLPAVPATTPAASPSSSGNNSPVGETHPAPQPSLTTPNPEIPLASGTPNSPVGASS